MTTMEEITRQHMFSRQGAQIEVMQGRLQLLDFDQKERRRRPKQVRQLAKATSHFSDSDEEGSLVKNSKMLLKEMEKKRQEKLELARIKKGDQKAKYKDDLEFLGDLMPKQVIELTSSFKSAGRQYVRQAKNAKEKGQWEPCIGSYNISTNNVTVDPRQAHFAP